MKGRMVCIHLTNIWLQREQHWMKELASAMFKPLWLYEQSEMLGLDWQAMLVWMAAGQSYPCLLLYAHCVYCTRAPATTQHCYVQHCELILPNILATACESYPLLSTWLQFAYIVHFEETLVPRSSISSYESEWWTLCSTAEETRGQCSRVENIIPVSSRHAPSPLHMSATTATNPLNYDTKWCSMFQP